MAATAAKNGSVSARKNDQTPAPEAEDLTAQVMALKSEVETLTRMLRDMAEDRSASLKTKVEDAADDTRARIEQEAQQLAETASNYRQEAESAVRANPGTALGIATGVGFLAGLLLARR